MTIVIVSTHHLHNGPTHVSVGNPDAWKELTNLCAAVCGAENIKTNKSNGFKIETWLNAAIILDILQSEGYSIINGGNLNPSSSNSSKIWWTMLKVNPHEPTAPQTPISEMPPTYSEVTNVNTVNP